MEKLLMTSGEETQPSGLRLKVGLKTWGEVGEGGAVREWGYQSYDEQHAYSSASSVRISSRRTQISSKLGRFAGSSFQHWRIRSAYGDAA
jgi:hypothetical protein